MIKTYLTELQCMYERRFPLPTLNVITVYTSASYDGITGCDAFMQTILHLVKSCTCWLQSKVKG